MLFQTPGGNMEVWQVLKTKNTQVYFNGEPAKEWTITWPMEPMISSQRAGVELPLHHEDHIQHKRPQNRTFQSQKKNSPFPLHHVFFGLRVTFYRPLRKNWTIAVHRWPSWAA